MIGNQIEPNLDVTKISSFPICAVREGKEWQTEGRFRHS